MTTDADNITALDSQLDQVLSLLAGEAQRRAGDPEHWRLENALKALARVRNTLDATGVPLQEKFWTVAVELRGIFRGWTDGTEQFVAGQDEVLGRKMVELYEFALIHSGGN
jgi:hypothetical protein